MILRGLGIGAAFIGLGVAFAACSDDTGTATDDAGTSPTGTTTSTSTSTSTSPTGTTSTPVPDGSVPDSATPDSSTPTDAGRDGSDGAVAPTFTQVYALFSGGGRCGNACHLRNNGSGGLSMQNQAMAYTNLVAAANASNPTTCGGGTQRVVANNTAMSKLYQKLAGTTCGGRMPQNGTAFNATELATVAGWINAGAPNN